MITLEEMETMLDEIASDFPQELFKELNGGILLMPEAKMNPVGGANDLFILGEYYKGGNMGRYIAIYYGSFARLFWYLGKEQLREKLIHTLKHEFTHHVESLAGERGLEIKDAQYISDYLKRKNHQK